MAGLLGTSLGVAFSSWFGADPSTLIYVSVPLSVLNLGCLYQANKAVVTKSLDTDRFVMATNEFVTCFPNTGV